MLPTRVLISFSFENNEGTQIRRAGEQRKERRKHVRYHVRVPVLFTWKKRGGAVFRCEGITRDISLRGAYVLSAICPPVDTFIEIRIILPRTLLAPNLLIAGKLRIQRVESSRKKKKSTGFSAVGSGFVVRSNSRLRPAIVKPGVPTKKRAGKTSIIEKLPYGSLETGLIQQNPSAAR